MNIKKLLFLSLAFSTACIHADGWLYRAYAGLFGHKTAQHSTIKKHGDKIAGVAIAVPTLCFLSWFGWKRHSAHKAAEWTVLDIELEHAKKDAELLKKKRQALIDAKPDHARTIARANKTQTEIDELDIKIEQAAEGYYNLVQQKRAVYVSELAEDYIKTTWIDKGYLITDDEMSSLKKNWESNFSHKISQGHEEGHNFMNQLANDTELREYNATIQTPLDNQKKQLEVELYNSKIYLSALRGQQKQHRLEKFFGEHNLPIK